MFDTRMKARSLAWLFSGVALVCLLTVVLPHVDAVQEGWVLSLAALALALAILCLRLADRLSDGLVHVLLAAGTLLLSLLIHYTHTTTLYALVYTWPALYAFYFFST